MTNSTQMRNPIADLEIDADLDADIKTIVDQLVAIAETNCDGRYTQILADGTERRPLDYQVSSMLSAMLSKCHRYSTVHAPQRDTQLRNEWDKHKALASTTNEIDSQVVSRIMGQKNAFDLECMFIGAIQKHANDAYVYISGKEWKPYVPPAPVKDRTQSESLTKAVDDVVASVDALFGLA